MYDTSPESCPGYYRARLEGLYRGSRVSEIEFCHPLDATLRLQNSFDHTRPLSEVKYYHPEESISYDISRVL